MAVATTVMAVATTVMAVATTVMAVATTVMAVATTVMAVATTVMAVATTVIAVATTVGNFVVDGFAQKNKIDTALYYLIAVMMIQWHCIGVNLADNSCSALLVI